MSLFFRIGIQAYKWQNQAKVERVKIHTSTFRIAWDEALGLRFGKLI